MPEYNVCPVTCQYFRIFLIMFFPVRKPYEHRSDSQRLRKHGNEKFKKIWILCRTPGSFFLVLQHHKINDIVSLLCLLRFHTPCSSYNLTHENLAEWGLVITMANSAAHYGQSVGQETAHLCPVPCVYWNMRCPFTHIGRIKVWHFWLRNTILRCWHKIMKSPDTWLTLLLLSR